MAEFPALPLWTDAYLGDTTHLTTIEHGAYMLLLMVAWRTRDTRLPDDDALLARYTRTTTAQWRRLRVVLEPFFTIENGFWVQRRLRDEADGVRQRRDSQAKAGRASALKRKGRHSAEREQSADEASTPTSTSTSTSSVTNVTDADEPKTIDEQPDAEAEPERPEQPELTAVDPEKVMFDSGKALLAAAGIPPARAGPILGKWRRDHGAEAVIVALGKAQREGAIDPVSFIEGALRSGGNRTSRHEPRRGTDGFTAAIRESRQRRETGPGGADQHG